MAWARRRAAKGALRMWAEWASRESAGDPLQRPRATPLDAAPSSDAIGCSMASSSSSMGLVSWGEKRRGAKGIGRVPRLLASGGGVGMGGNSGG